MEVSDFCLRKNTQEKQEKSSMMVTKYLKPLYDSFGQAPQTSVYINSNTSVDLDPTGFEAWSLHFDRANVLHINVDV
jgi:hypothetical protein